MFARLLLAATLITATGQAAYSQELRPLQDVFSQSANPYAPTRCAALYQAIMEWSGLERMGEDAWKQSDEVRKHLITMSAMIAQAESGGTPEERVTVILRDVANIAMVYQSRFEAHYAVTGSAFSGDGLVESDLQFCKKLAEGSL